MCVINVFSSCPCHSSAQLIFFSLFFHLLTSDSAAVNTFLFVLACLFLQCSVNTVVTPHSHVLNLTSVLASAPHVCLDSNRTDGALEQCSSRPPPRQYSRNEVLDLQAGYPCSDDIHRQLQDPSLSVVPAPPRCHTTDTQDIQTDIGDQSR